MVMMLLAKLMYTLHLELLLNMRAVLVLSGVVLMEHTTMRIALMVLLYL